MKRTIWAVNNCCVGKCSYLLKEGTRSYEKQYDIINGKCEFCGKSPFNEKDYQESLNK